MLVQDWHLPRANTLAPRFATYSTDRCGSGSGDAICGTLKWRPRLAPDQLTVTTVEHDRELRVGAFYLAIDRYQEARAGFGVRSLRNDVV